MGDRNGARAGGGGRDRASGDRAQLAEVAGSQDPDAADRDGRETESRAQSRKDGPVRGEPILYSAAGELGQSPDAAQRGEDRRAVWPRADARSRSARDAGSRDNHSGAT